MASKTQFLQQTLDAATQAAQLSDKMEILLEVWFTRGYAGGSSNPITQADIDPAFGASSGITLAAIQNFANFMDQYQKFRTNQIAVQGDYTATLNTLRSDI